jgi:hypothetical protein
LAPTPLVKLSGNLCSEGFAMHGEVLFDIASRRLSKYNVGFYVVKFKFSVVVILYSSMFIALSHYSMLINNINYMFIVALD